MLHILFAIACLCSSYAVASEKGELDKIAQKAHYDKILDDKITDPTKRAEYAKGYIVLRNQEGSDISILPLSDVYVGVPILDAHDNVSSFMSFPLPIANELNKEIEQRLAEKNKNKLELTK